MTFILHSESHEVMAHLYAADPAPILHIGDVKRFHEEIQRLCVVESDRHH